MQQYELPVDAIIEQRVHWREYLSVPVTANGDEKSSHFVTVSYWRYLCGELDAILRAG